MATAAQTRITPPRREAGAAPARPSGVMPAFRGKVSLPTPSSPFERKSAVQPRASLPTHDVEDEARLWAEKLAEAKLRAAAEEEEREWAAAMARARAQLVEEEGEWKRLRSSVSTQHAPRVAPPPRRVVSWP